MSGGTRRGRAAAPPRPRAVAPAAGRAAAGRAAAAVAALTAAAAPAPAGAQAGRAVGPPLASLAERPRTAEARRARDAVRDYERGRRRQLPDFPGGAPGERCDVRIGRLCYWDNNDDTPPAPEPPAALLARTALLADLAAATAADSADDWAAGQQVRYLLELGRSAEAARAAAGCRGTPWWCQALVSLARHAAGDHEAAAAAHDSARTLLPDDAARCAWDDVVPWLPDPAARAYRRLACGSAERARYERRFWRLVQPFWALPANDLRTELAARRTLARLHAVGPNPYALAWGDDLAELDVRYGVPVAWSVRRPSYGSTTEPSVVGHEPTPSYDFTPDARTLAPAALLTRPLPAAPAGAGAWALRRPLAQMRYAPRYAAFGVAPLDHQLARFRRGDTLVVVAAYAAPDTWRPAAGTGPAASTGPAPTRSGDGADSAPATAPSAALVLDDSAAAPVAAVVRDRAPLGGVLVARLAAPPSPATTPAADSAVARLPGWLASLELLDTAGVTPDTAGAGRRWRPPGGPQRGRAARVRTPLAALPGDALVSDLLLVRPGDYGPAPALAALADSAAGAPVVRAGGQFGLFWEQYAGPSGALAAATVAISATRLDVSAWERLGALVGRTVVERPVSLRYTDPVPAGAGPGRYVTLRWPVVPAGTYRLEVVVTPAANAAGDGSHAASAARVVRLIR